MTDRELMQMALDALCCFVEYDFKGNPVNVQSIEGAKAIEALRAALANEFNPDWDEVEALQESLREHMAEIQRLRAALAQSEPEPVATLWQHGETGRTRVVMNGDITDCGANWIRVSGLYTTPPQREWQGLTDEEMHECAGESPWTPTGLKCCRAIEAKLKEKNT